MIMNRGHGKRESVNQNPLIKGFAVHHLSVTDPKNQLQAVAKPIFFYHISVVIAHHVPAAIARKTVIPVFLTSCNPEDSLENVILTDSNHTVRTACTYIHRTHLSTRSRSVSHR